MNLNKHLEFFNPTQIKDQIHIIGCGAIGSHLATQLTRIGLSQLHLYDFDTVEPHNITNQSYYPDQTGILKVIALRNNLHRINSDSKIHTHTDGYTTQMLNGHVFLCVDNIETRLQIATAQQYNPMIHAFFDFRMRLTDAQHYAADWMNPEQKERFLQSMQFSSEEAKEATPMNACGSTLSIAPTVHGIIALGIANFINFINTQSLKTVILHDPFHQITDAF